MVQDYLKKFDVIPETILVGGAPGVEDSHKQIVYEVLKEHGIESARWVGTGAVISSHGGPGAIGLEGIEKA